jgi:hypothetical protein
VEKVNNLPYLPQTTKGALNSAIVIAVTKGSPFRSLGHGFNIGLTQLFYFYRNPFVL